MTWCVTHRLAHRLFCFLHSIVACFGKLDPNVTVGVTVKNGYKVSLNHAMWGDTLKRDLRFAIIIGMQGFFSTQHSSSQQWLGWVGLGLGLAKQWISLLRPVLGCFAGLIHHIRVWEPRKWPTDISLTKGLMSEADGHSIWTRQFQHISKPTPGASLLAPLWITISSLWAGGRAPDLTVASLRWAYRWRWIFTALPLGVRHTGSSVPLLFWFPHAHH